jgi:predicted XRE-type DNA-binding protein
MSLADEFKDHDYRRAYADSFANSVIATQIRLLRGTMTQKEFAELVGIKQSRVSAMEDENYASWSTRMLKRIAARKDVVFLGRFYSFGEFLNRHVRNFSEDDLRVPDFANDPYFAVRPSLSGTVSTATTSQPSLTTVAKTSINLTAGVGKTAVMIQHLLPLLGVVSTSSHGRVSTESSARGDVLSVDAA